MLTGSKISVTVSCEKASKFYRQLLQKNFLRYEVLTFFEPACYYSTILNVIVTIAVIFILILCDT